MKKIIETFNKLKIKNSVLNSLIFVLSIIVLYLLYTFINHNFLRPPVSSVNGNKVIQVDVLNGCGASGIAVKFTEFLRARGFDVLEMGNYKSFDVESSIVLDRIGNPGLAKKVANAIGIDEKNIIQQISNDSYIDCTIVIGRDYKNLKPMK